MKRILLLCLLATAPLLARADLVTQVFRSTRPGWPLPAYDDLSAFKIYLGDIGVLRRLAGIDASILAGQPPAFTEFRGVMAENYALQALTPQLDVAPRYWSHLNPSHEVDFLLQYDDSVIPVEVKSGTVVTSRSLTYYQTKFGTTTPLRVRLSGQNLQLKSGLLNIPLPLADQAQRLIGLALGIR